MRHMKLQPHLLGKFMTLSVALTLMGQATFANTTYTTTSSNVVAVPEAELPLTTQSLIDYSNLTVEGLLLPESLYILQGSSNQLERFNIYYKNAYLAQLLTSKLNVYSPYGQTLFERWLFQSGTTFNFLPDEPFTLSARLFLDSKTTVDQDVTITIVDQENTTPVRLLAIGDSLTRAGVYLNEIQNSIPNTTLVGTRYYPTDGIPAREGRGGWTLDRYMTSINSSDLDSPFVFPEGVSGANYKGNTRDWKSICYTNAKHSTYDGFQKIARGWQDEGEYLYDTNGYYKNPSTGDVMVDPSLPEGKQWVVWTGSTWETMSIQPTIFEFNFIKYMERFKAAFTEGTPTHVSIFLGANDFGYNNRIYDLEGYMAQLNEMIDSIHAFDPSIKVVLCTPTPAPNTNKITDSRLSFYYSYDRNMKLATYYLLQTFDNEASRERGVYLAPTHLTLDTNSGFDYKETTEVINGAPTKVVSASNGIHPNNTVGQLQMGDTIAAVLQYTR